MQKWVILFVLMSLPILGLAQDKAAETAKTEAGAEATTGAASPSGQDSAGSTAPADPAAPVPSAQKTEKTAAADGDAAQQAAGKTEAPEEDKKKDGNVIMSYLNDGGFMMWVILSVSILGLLIFLERASQMHVKQRLNASAFVSSVLQPVEAREYRKALDACKVGSKHPLIGIMSAGVSRANRREAEIERAMEDKMLSAIPDLNKRIGLLNFLANSCTLLGLLGTIFGLIQAFSAVSNASAAQKQQVLSEGISVAMYTTAFGIVAAIPLLFFHHLLSARQEEIMNEMEGGATALLVALCGSDEDQSSSSLG